MKARYANDRNPVAESGRRVSEAFDEEERRTGLRCLTGAAILAAGGERKPHRGDNWGNWIYSPTKPSSLHYKSLRSGYWIDLSRLEDSNDALEIIHHVSAKTWMSREDIGALYDALNDLGYVRPYEEGRWKRQTRATTEPSR